MGGDIVLWMLGLLVLLIVLGTHIGIALAVCSALGVWLILGSMEAAVSILGNTAYEAVRKDVSLVPGTGWDKNSRPMTSQKIKTARQRVQNAEKI